MLPHLRDFSKAPFILLCVALSLFASKRRLGYVSCVSLCAAAGAVLGVGLGFRFDLTMLIPLVVVLRLGFGQWRGIRGFVIRIGCCCIFLAAVVSTSLPILAMYRIGGGNSFHWINLGLMSYFDPLLNVDTPTTHELGHLYNDMFVGELVNDYAQQHAGEITSKLEYGNAQYNAYGRSYYLAVLRTFPADMMIRAIAAPLGAYGGWPDPVARWIGVCLSMLALGLLFAKSMRMALVAATIVTYLGVVVFLQFDVRHWFYLVIVPIVATCLLSQALVDALQRRMGGWNSTVAAVTLVGATDSTRVFRPGFVARLGSLILMCACCYSLLMILRWYQQRSVADLLDKLARLPRLSCAFDRLADDGTVALVPVSQELAPPIGSRLWLLELSAPSEPGSATPKTEVRVNLECGGAGFLGVDHSRELLFSLPAAEPSEPILRYVFFTLNAGCTNPTITLAAEYAPLVTQFCELDRSAAGPLLVNAQLPVMGGVATPYQTLKSMVPQVPLHVPQLDGRDRPRWDLTTWLPSGIALFEELPTGESAGQWRVFRAAVTGGAGRRAFSAMTESVAPGVHRVAVVAKAGDLDQIQLAGTRDHGFYANFDLSAGVVTRRGASTPSASIEPLGGGWYRLSADFWWRRNRQNFPLRQLLVIDGQRDPARSESVCQGFFYLAVPRHDAGRAK
jgi:hypothetical protein